MKLYQFWLANAAALAVSRYYYVPKLRRYIEHHRSVATIRKGAELALASWIETLLLLGVISGGLVIAVTLIFHFAGGATAPAVGHAIERLQEGRRLLAGFGPKWGSLVLTLGIIALGVHAHRRGKLRMARAFEAVRDRELERLSRQAKEGKWEDLPPTADMQRVGEHAAKLVAAMADPRYASARDQIIVELGRLKQVYFHLDLQRRLDMRLTPEEAALPEPQTRGEKVQTFFISRGLWGALKRPARLAYLCNFALLIPSLLGVYSLPSQSAFNHRFVTLAELQVELSQQEALASWQRYQPALGAEKKDERELDDDEVQTLRHTARVFERSVARAEQFRSFRVSSSSNERAVRSALARKHVLHAAAEATPGSVAEVMPESVEKAMGPKERAVWEAYTKKDPPHTTTSAGERVFEELASHARRSPPGFVARLKVALQTPVGQADLVASVSREALGTLLGDHLGQEGGFLSGMDPLPRKAFANAVRTQSRRFVAEILRTDGAGLADAANAVHKPFTRDMEPVSLQQFQEYTRSHPLSPGDGEGLIATIRQQPPALDPAPDPRADRGKVFEIIRRRVTGSDADKLGKAFRYSQPLAEFSSYFPASEESFMKALDSSTIRSLVGDIERSSQILKSRSTSRARSARVFEGLKGFSKVGGVLLGIPPEARAKALDYPGFAWEVNGGRVRFTLTDPDGKSAVSRWWDATIAAQALTYAADGRPLAVTIVNCSPLTDQKVLLHAALVDTGLGYRLMELDHFVSDYAWEGRENPELAHDWKEADELVHGHVALYQYALNRCRLLIAHGLLPMLTEDGKRAFRSEFERWEEWKRAAEKPDLNGAPSELAEALARGGGAFQDKQRSVLMAKPAYFEESIVKAMSDAIRPGQSLSQFGDGLDRAFRSYMPSAFKSQVALLQSEAPIISTVSGVREKPFRVEPSEFFVAADAKIPEILDYVAQVTFQTAARGDRENTADPDPWQFPLLAGRIRAAVAKGITSDDRSRAIHASANEFTFLQRFFRLALDGQLGNQFPVERLADLGRELRKGAPSEAIHTIRWNTRPGARETALRDHLKAIREGPPAQLCGELLPLLDEIAMHTKALEAAQRGAGDHERAWTTFASAQEAWLQRWRPKVDEVVLRWGSSGSLDDELKAVLFALEEFRMAIDLRDALAVTSDDRQCWLDRTTRRLPSVGHGP